ncbi:MAG: MFS transporter, partial [Alphaproteobacteria bacterium]|nr:MFS transporter [Alphaproteobacteria bacterium]
MSQAPLTPEKVRFVVLIGVAAGLTAFDETSLGVVLPTLRQEFGTTHAATHWVVNAYLVVMASLVAAAGRLADFVPADSLWRGGLVVFTVTSVAAGFAPDVGWL